MAAQALVLLGCGLTGSGAFAGWPLHKAQVVYAAPAPLVYAGQAPVAYTALAPVGYTALAPGGCLSQAPVTFAAQAPVAYTAQAPVTYTAQAPTTYTAQAPVTYTAQAPTTTYTAQAPTTYTAQAPVASNLLTGAAPTANAPGSEGVRVSTTLRNALLADLVAYYHSEESGTTRMEKIRAVRDRARQEYEGLLEGEDNPELNQAEEQDLKTLVDLVISGGTGGAPRTYYPPLAPPSGYGNAAYGATTMMAPAAAVVPVALQPLPAPTHRLFHKP